SGLGIAWAEANAQHRSSPDAIYAAIAGVGPEDVNRVLRSYYTPEHRLSMVINPKPSSTVPKVDPNAGVEHIGFTPKRHEPLPRWAEIALEVPLRAPADAAGTLRRTLPNGLRYVARRETAAPTIVLSGVIRTS